jgi:hypothetical protein
MPKILGSFFGILPMKMPYGQFSSDLLRRIRRKRYDRAFTPSDLADLGDPRTIGKALTRLVQAGTIRRVKRVIYELPRAHPLLGSIGASSDAIVAAVARRDGLKLLPSGAHAANLLGLSTQVAARTSYGVQGPARSPEDFGRTNVTFKKRSSRAMMLAGRSSGWVSEALRNIGRIHLTPERLGPLRDRLDDKAKKQLKDDIRYVPAWMRPIFEDLSRDA